MDDEYTWRQVELWIDNTEWLWKEKLHVLDTLKGMILRGEYSIVTGRRLWGALLGLGARSMGSIVSWGEGGSASEGLREGARVIEREAYAELVSGTYGRLSERTVGFAAMTDGVVRDTRAEVERGNAIAETAQREVDQYDKMW